MTFYGILQFSGFSFNVNARNGNATCAHRRKALTHTQEIITTSSVALNNYCTQKSNRKATISIFLLFKHLELEEKTKRERKKKNKKSNSMGLKHI